MNMKVMPIGYEIIKPWLLQKHYALRMPSISFAYGLYSEANDLVGVIWASMHDITVTGCKVWVGQGGGNNANGYYRENLDEGTIEFSGSGSEVILEYISDGSSGLEGKEIKIHSFAQEALKAYIYWRSIYRKRAINMNENMVAKKEYYNQKRLARARMQSFNKQEAMQTTRKAFKQAPKI